MDSMNGSTVNLTPQNLWAECYSYFSYHGSLPKMGIPSAGVFVFYLTVFFEFIVGFPSNLWLVCHILKKRSKSTGIRPSDFFPFHMGLTQLVSFLIVPVLISSHFVKDQKVILLTMGAISTIILVIKPLLLCMMCLEIYAAVVQPTTYLRYKANKYKWRCLVITWCIYILVACMSILHSTPSVRCALFPFILAADTFCCLSIFKTLKKPTPGDKTMAVKAKRNEPKNMSPEVQKDMKERREGAASSGVKGKQEIHSLKKKALITIVLIQFVLSLNYVPSIIIMSLETQLPPQIHKCQLVPLALAAAYSCTYMQPLLYLKSLGKLSFTKPRSTWLKCCFAQL